MAELNPNIALSFNPGPSPLATLGQMANLGKIATDIQTAQTAMPGVAAQAQSAQIKAEQDRLNLQGRQKLMDIYRNVSTVNPDGTVSIDNNKAVGLLAASGFASEAFNLMKNIAESESAKVKSDADKETFVRNFTGLMANGVNNLPEDVRPKAFENGINWLKQQYPEYANHPIVNLPYSDAVSKGLAAGTITPKEAEELKLQAQAAQTAQFNAETSRMSTQHQINMSFDTPDGRNADSMLSQQMRKFAAQAGFPVPDNMTAFEMYKVEPLRKVMEQAATSSVISQETKANAFRQNVDLSTATKTMEEGMAAIDRLHKSGALPKNRIGTGVGAYLEQFTQNPDVRLVKDALAMYKSITGRDYDITQGLGPLQASMSAELKRRKAQMEANKALQTKPTIPAATEQTTEQPTTTPTAPAPQQTGTVKMRSPDGKVVLPVPANEVEEAAKMGWKKE